MAILPHIALEYLDRARVDQHLAHAYIVSGLEASSRLAFAAALAGRLNGPRAADFASMGHEGVHLVEPQSKSRAISIDQIRALEHVIHQRAGEGRHKIGVIVEADRMTPQATNAFLKTLEEPPPDSLLLLLTGTPSLLLDTVVSRCLRLALTEPPQEGGPVLSETQQRLLDALAVHFAHPPSPSRALGFVRVYTALLAEEKAALADACTAQYKREAAHYDRKTDAGPWLKQREEHFETLAHARYLQARSQALGLVIRWFGDLIRRHTGHPKLDFPQYATLITLASSSLPLHEWLRRMACLEDLRRAYETNVFEALATELAFLGALG